MALGRIRKYWFYSWVLVQIPLNLFNLALGIMAAVDFLPYKSNSPVQGVEIVVQVLFFLICLSNTIYLATYGSLYTKTIIGSFVAQQAASCLIVAGYTVLLVFPAPFEYSYIISSVTMTSTGIQILVSFILYGLFIQAKRSNDPVLGHWSVDVEDLASRALPPPTGTALSWRGVRRYGDRLPRRGRATRALGWFLYNSIFRRVHPVETKTYAFFQHFFSLVAIVLLLTRTVVLLVQLGNEGLPSRTRVEQLEIPASMSSYAASVLIRYQDDHSRGSDMVPNGISTFNVSIALQANSTSSFRNSTNLCKSKFIQTRPNSAGLTDWFWHHTCDHLEQWRYVSSESLDSSFGFQYTMDIRQGPQSQMNKMPDIWIVAGVDDPDLRTPYFTAPIQPIPEMHSVYHTHYAFRRSVSSSPLWDAISGSKPTYDTVRLFPGSESNVLRTYLRVAAKPVTSLIWLLTFLNHAAAQVYSRPMRRADDSANIRLHSSGFIHWPRYLPSSPQISQSDFEPGTAAPDRLVEVTEEYRTGNTFDILASIGGLFALLQGIHIFLFGRPLFWGMFGIKMISPFGFVGRFATRSFRQRLYEHYYPAESRPTSDVERNDPDPSNNVDMTRFLLDFVLDLGPASATGQETRPRPTESSTECVRVEMGDLSRSKESLSQDSVAVEKEDRSFLPSTR